MLKNVIAQLVILSDQQPLDLGAFYLLYSNRNTPVANLSPSRGI
jgi:hypothetical protein